MDRIDRWIMIFILMLLVICGAWRWLEEALYGFAQESAVDTVAGLFIAAVLATWIERGINRWETL